MHWAAKTAIGTGITVTVAAILAGGWSIYQNTRKIPELEQASARQQRDIVTIKATMVNLMQQTGHPPTVKDLEKLMSSVGDFGAGTARLVSRANLTISGRPTTAYYAWVPPNARDTLRHHVETYAAWSSIEDPHAIGTIIASSLVSADSGGWVLSSGRLRGTFTGWSIVLTPKDGITAADLGVWATEANTLRSNLRTVTAPNAVAPKAPRRQSSPSP